MSDNRIEPAVLDTAGTAVTDGGLVLRAFEAAATAAGTPAEGPEYEAAVRYVVDTMRAGRSARKEFECGRAAPVDHAARRAGHPDVPADQGGKVTPRFERATGRIAAARAASPLAR
ncbi:hypothetical protein [Nocardia sp. BMG51109]|uniref:hypothetical protein n=1 Tax=Nocardia sp. BMG51109 TaxID=1056816 RepID=UPI000465F729